MHQEALLDLVHNIALLLGMALIFDLLTSRRSRLPVLLRQGLAGLAVGAAGIALMLTPWVFTEGVVFDTRSVLLAISGLFLGAVPTLIGVAVTAWFRWFQGGAAAGVGICVIVASGTIGLCWRAVRRKRLADIPWFELYLMGLLVHEVMLLLMRSLPGELSERVLSAITFPVLLIYPVGTAALGVLLTNRLRRHRISAALRESEEEIRSTLYGIGDGVIATDVQGVITRMNGVAERLTGWDEKEAKGRPLAEVFDIVNEQTRELAHNPVERVLREGAVVGLANHTVLINRDGTERPVADSASPIRDEDDALCGVVMVFRDQSEERAAQKALLESESRFRQVVESAPEGIFVQTDGKFAYLNPAARMLFGASAEEEMLGKLVAERFHSRDRAAVEARISELNMQGQRVPLVEERIVRCDGVVRETEVSAVPFVFKGRSGALVFIRDISDRKQAQAKMVEAKDEADRANRAKDEFLARLSHELRTPLTPVLLATSQWCSCSGLPAALETDMAMMQRNLELEARLLDDLLDLNRILQGKLSLQQQVVDMHRQIRQALDILKADVGSKQLQVTLDLKAAPALLQGDPTRVQQVMWNLLSNSIKFTPPGGRIAVSTHSGPGQTIIVEVRDNGVGIEKHILPRLFKPFEQGGGRTTARYGGMGLGLAICRSVVDMHGGAISVSSEGQGRGTLVTMSLPASAGAALRTRSQEVSPPPAEEAAAVRRVLLVEDHADTAKLLARVIRTWGCEVCVADSVAGALAAAEGKTFDLLISDLGLPDGSGHDLMRALAAKGPLCAIAVSGYGMEEDQRRSREVGFQAHLTKPVNMADLRATIERMLGREGRGASRCGSLKA